MELPEHLTQLAQLYVEQGLAASPIDAVEKAFACFESRNGDLTQDHLHQKIEKLRGLAKGWTFEDMLRERRDGLH